MRKVAPLTIIITSRLFEDVLQLLHETAALDIMPLFLDGDGLDVSEKSPGEVVTQADRNAEQRLSAGLTKLLPGSMVIGEETWTKTAPSESAVFGDAPVWAIDPLDGTTAFIEGDPEFAIMVALIQHGKTRAAWIHAPVPGWTAVAEQGSGATLDGVPIRTAVTVEPCDMLGSVRLRFLPDELRGTVTHVIPTFRKVVMTGSSGWDHVAVAQGSRHFSLYYRTLVWDHAAGCLILSEAGGKVARLDGSPYTPLVDSTGLLTACSPETWQIVHQLLLPSVTAEAAGGG